MSTWWALLVHLSNIQIYHQECEDHTLASKVGHCERKAMSDHVYTLEECDFGDVDRWLQS